MSRIQATWSCAIYAVCVLLLGVTVAVGGPGPSKKVGGNPALGRALEIVLQYRDSISAALLQGDPRDVWAQRNLAEGFAKSCSTSAAFWQRPVDTLRNHAKETLTAFMRSGATALNKASTGANYIVHPRVVEVALLLLSAEDSALAKQAFALLNRTGVGVLVGLDSASRSAIGKMARTASEYSYVPFVALSPAELSAVPKRPRWYPLPARAAMGDTIAEDSLITAFRSAKNRREAEAALHVLASIQSDRAARELVRAFAQPCYRDSTRIAGVTIHSLRSKIVKYLERYDPSEPFFADSIYFINYDQRMRDSATVARFVERFRVWAKNKYAIDLPADDTLIPLRGPCDITVHWYDSSNLRH